MTKIQCKLLVVKLGCDWDILKNLVFSAKSNIRMNRIKANKDDVLIMITMVK